PSVAILGVLLLRGPQTVGELRQRTERLHHFAELGEVQSVLDDLSSHPFGALVEELPRQPGRKETRWRHLLGGQQPGDPAVAQPGAAGAAEAVDVDARAEVVQLGVTLAELQAEVVALRDELDRIRRFVGA
ncbi:MAG TPA: DUF480 domain-containing protein, partial [Euzebya sp.]|nr:DUF480 domain-containing protein [Euzebya sp.]